MILEHFSALEASLTHPSVRDEIMMGTDGSNHGNHHNTAHNLEGKRLLLKMMSLPRAKRSGIYHK